MHACVTIVFLRATMYAMGCAPDISDKPWTVTVLPFEVLSLIGLILLNQQIQHLDLNQW
jgi:hypothetical protein